MAKGAPLASDIAILSGMGVRSRAEEGMDRGWDRQRLSLPVLNFQIRKHCRTQRPVLARKPAQERVGPLPALYPYHVDREQMSPSLMVPSRVIFRSGMLW